jgi:hypothetical protein
LPSYKTNANNKKNVRGAATRQPTEALFTRKFFPAPPKTPPKHRNKMIPPKYGDIGKSANDLLGKDFPFGQVKLEVKTTAANGMVHKPPESTLTHFHTELYGEWQPRQQVWRRCG